MIELSLAMTLIAALFVGFGMWMIVVWFSRKARGHTGRKYPHWLSGSVFLVIGILLLVLAATDVFTSRNLVPVIAFWVPVCFIAELPVILVWIWYWPQAMRWGMERKTLNPPWPLLVVTFLGGVLFIASIHGGFCRNYKGALVAPV